MMKAQKIIKYFAIAFAILLIYNIFQGIFALCSFMDNDNKNIDNKDLHMEQIEQNINDIDIDIKYANLIIKSNSKFKIETNIENLDITQDRGSLKIKQNEENWLKNKSKYKIILYLPYNQMINNFELDGGAGEIDIESLKTNKLDLNLGAGKVSIDNLYVTSSSRIKGGAGELDIEGEINNLDLKLGVGETNINAKLKGENYIECGVGKLELDLVGHLNDYMINFEKGIGRVTFNDKTINEKNIYGTGNNNVRIKGGIGSVDVELDY